MYSRAQKGMDKQRRGNVMKRIAMFFNAKEK